ncbi:hypothetical protein GCM10011574_30260 [Microbispora bryophytorum]|uniref:Uncharacterized protein n=1 Tax=Microbispora bryophytorum TaxID=1460882 RepID=A0A8H9LAA7_9ACTN|nr:hypothetical protein GCM10011574_30260 [Microbispora bryophytorum]
MADPEDPEGAEDVAVPQNAGVPADAGGAAGRHRGGDGPLRPRLSRRALPARTVAQRRSCPGPPPSPKRRLRTSPTFP